MLINLLSGVKQGLGISLFRYLVTLFLKKIDEPCFERWWWQRSVVLKPIVAGILKVGCLEKREILLSKVILKS